MLCCCIKKKRSGKEKSTKFDVTDMHIKDGMMGLEFHDFSDGYSINPTVTDIAQQRQQLPAKIDLNYAHRSPLERRSSFTSIFSSFGDIFPQAVNKELPKGIDVDISPLDKLEEKMVQYSQSTKNYYTLTWTTPESTGKSGSHHSSQSYTAPRQMKGYTDTARRGSSISDKRGSSSSSHSLRPLKLSSNSSQFSDSSQRQRSYDRPTKLSSAANDLSFILEGSLEGADNSEELSVFKTPDDSNVYFPNPNSPVSTKLDISKLDTMELDTIKPDSERDSESDRTFTIAQYNPTINPPLPPNNTPMEGKIIGKATPTTMTSSSEVSRWTTSLYNNRNIIGHGYRPVLDIDQSSWKVIMHDQAKLRQGSQGTAPLPPSATHSVVSHDLNHSAIPVHCSTINGFAGHYRSDTSDVDYLSFRSNPTQGFHDAHQAALFSNAARDCYQNQAYKDIFVVDSSATETHEDKDNASLNSVVCGCCASTCTSCVKLPSGQTSLNVQVGSFEVSTHSSDVSCPEQQQHLVQYSVYTNSTTDTTHISKDHVFSHMIGRSKVPDTPVSLVMRAPANSPQTFATDYSGFTTSSGRLAGDERTDSRNVSSRGIVIPRARALPTPAMWSIKQLDTPLLAPEVFWV